MRAGVTRVSSLAKTFRRTAHVLPSLVPARALTIDSSAECTRTLITIYITISGALLLSILPLSLLPTIEYLP